MSQTLPRVDDDIRPFGLSDPIGGVVSTVIPPDGGDQDLPSPLRNAASPAREPAVIELAIPVYNEQEVLEASVRRLRTYLDECFPFETTIRIVDNASTDATWEVAQRIAATVPGVEVQHLDRKGRGYALRSAWSASTAEIVAYMDVDLSTDLGGFLPLVAPLLSGHSDVAIGSRLARGAHVVRGPKRELISRAYNLLLKVVLRGSFSDAQCGFKALRRESALELLPLVEDDEWFFDTELLVTAERLGLRICEVPVNWIDDPDSRVQLWHTIVDDLRGIWRLSHARARHLTGHHSGLRRSKFEQVTADQLFRFAGVGVLSTLGYLALFIAWRSLLGNFGANAVALAICTLCNLAIHKELSKRMQGPIFRGRFIAVAAGLYATSLLFTSLALVAAHVVDSSSLLTALGAIITANAGAIVLRFAVLRAWIFRPASSTPPGD
jgi:glycosyltransferase involved in cell wall biosynthesis